MDLLPIADAQSRYDIGKTALHARIRHCRISPVRTGNRSFLNAQHLEILDALDQHLATGHGMADFHSPIAELVEEEVVTDRSPIVRREETAPVRIELPPIAAYNRIDDLRKLLEFLSDCAERGWLLPTSEIHNLIGASPRRTGWSRYGFVFEAAGTHGNQTAWSVRAME